MPRSQKIPTYRLHRPSGQARVIIDGRHVYLGPYGSEESKAEYDRLVRKLLTERTAAELEAKVQLSTDLTVAELAAAYLNFARTYYVKHDRLTPEFDHIRSALQPVIQRHGEELVTAFGPLKLKAIRQAWIDEKLVRGQINKRVGRIRRMFAWGVEEELVPTNILVALRTIKGLRAGRSGASEGKKVLPVPDEHVDAIRPHVARQVWAMIELQRLTGMRPGEVCVMRTGDITMSGRVWEYRPLEHKMEHVEKDRLIHIGPRAQEIVKPWLRANFEEFLFSPREAMAERSERRRASRKTPVQPSQRDRCKKRPERAPGERYTRASYGHAIALACRKAKVPHWTPNQIRHTVGTKVRREMGLEASQVVLGHSRADVTQVYAERNAELARQAMERLG
jgi:integrase